MDFAGRAESAALLVRRSHQCATAPRRRARSLLAFKYQAIVAFLILSALIASYRMRSNYMTPDEIKFAEGELLERSYSEGISLHGDGGAINLKYIVTTYLLRHLFKGDLLLCYLVNAALVVWVMLRSYRVLVKDAGVLMEVGWAILFVLPNVVFYPSSLLRDIHVFVCVYLLLTYYQERSPKGMFVSWAAVAILRPEVGAVLLVAGVLARRSVKLIVAAGLCYVLAYGLLFDYFLDHYMHTQRSNDTLGIWEFSYLPGNFPRAVLSNIVLFWFPFLSSEVPGRMAEVYRIESWVLLGVLAVGVARFSYDRFCDERLYRFCIIALFLFFPIASMEHNGGGAIRHMLSLLPAFWIACMSVPSRSRLRANHGIQPVRERRTPVCLVR
jgi:hypothetical protein